MPTTSESPATSTLKPTKNAGKTGGDDGESEAGDYGGEGKILQSRH